jgi:hypothetical protein
MRKGADCLSKWVGEAERQLRLLFEQATRSQPSIIFFDELDGLAPVRSSRQDHIHSSIVSTLLALMDGLDSRGQVIVIGATNRVDAIDPALRRPGRSVSTSPLHSTPLHSPHCAPLLSLSLSLSLALSRSLSLSLAHALSHTHTHTHLLLPLVCADLIES